MYVFTKKTNRRLPANFHPNESIWVYATWRKRTVAERRHSCMWSFDRHGGGHWNDKWRDGYSVDNSDMVIRTTTRRWAMGRHPRELLFSCRPSDHLRVCRRSDLIHLVYRVTHMQVNVEVLAHSRFFSECTSLRLSSQ